jgi:hypothetical protein
MSLYESLQVNEHSSASFSAELWDEDGAPIGADAVSLARLTLYDVSTGTVLNGRDDQDVLNTNDVVIEDEKDDSDTITRTVLRWAMQPDDNRIVNQTRRSAERHAALWTIEWTGGHVHHETAIAVRPLRRIPRAAES